MGMSKCLECEGYGDSKNHVDDCYWGDAGYVCLSCCEHIRDDAEKRVANIGYGIDSPGYEICVAGAMKDIIEEKHIPSRDSEV